MIQKLQFLLRFLVNGKWGKWGKYSACTKTCGTGRQTRTRACNNPKPSGGGQKCPGSPSETKKCYIKACPGRNDVITS